MHCAWINVSFHGYWTLQLTTYVRRGLKRKSDKRYVRLTWFSSNRWRCPIRFRWTPINQSCDCFFFLFVILIYASVTKTSLRNHTVSLVAASPTRYPGPLHCSNMHKPTENSPHSHTKPDLSIFPGQRWFQGFLSVDISGRRSAFTAPCLSLSLSHRAAKMTEAGNHMRLVQRARQSPSFTQGTLTTLDP